MRAWTVDADDIQVAEDFNESLLHRTPEIEGFLRSDRDDKFIVIGTKGFGKTLLLKAKRILYQREGRAACLPVGALLDKPIGDKIFSRELLAFFVVSPLPWSKIWLTAISLAALKHLGAVRELKVGSALASLIADEQLHGVIDHFVRLLEFTRASYNVAVQTQTATWCRACARSPHRWLSSSMALMSISTSTSKA